MGLVEAGPGFDDHAWVAALEAAGGLERMELGSLAADCLFPSLPPGLNVLSIRPPFFSGDGVRDPFLGPDGPGDNNWVPE